MYFKENKRPLRNIKGNSMGNERTFVTVTIGWTRVRITKETSLWD